MSYLFKKFIRELWGLKYRGILVVLSISLAIGMYGGLLLVHDSVLLSRDNVFEEINYEDARIKLYSVVDETRIANILDGINGISLYDFRLTIDVVLSFNSSNFPAALHNIHTKDRPKINDFIMKEGNYFSDNSSNEIIIDNRFAAVNNISLGDEISIRYGNIEINQTVRAIVFAPEHMYSVNPSTGMPEKGVFTPIWYSLEEIAKQLNIPIMINEILIKVDDIKNVDQVISDIKSSLDKNGYLAEGIRGDQELDYNMMEEDVGSLNEFAIAIGLVILIVAMFIIYDSILKIINSQTTLIGVMSALGASVSTLLIHYLGFGMILTFIGVLLALPLGFYISTSFTSMFIEIIGLDIATNQFSITPFIPAILLSLSIAFIASIIGSYKIINLKPVEAINNQKIKQDFTKTYFIERIFDVMFRKNKYSIKIPVRNVFRRKKRSILTAMTIAVAALIILSSYGFLDSFFNQMDVYYDENYVYDLEVSLVDPIPLQKINDQMSNITDISSYEGMIRQPAYLIGSNSNESSIIYAYKQDTRMRNYGFKEGSLVPGQIAIGNIMAEKLNVGIGDSIVIQTRGITMFTIIELEYKISGVLEEFFDNFVFMDLSSLQQEFGYGGDVNAIAIKTEMDTDIVKNDLLSTTLSIVNIIDIKQSRDSFEAMMEAMIGFAYFVILLGIIVLILFSLNVIVLDTMERDREFVNIRVNGGSLRVISRIITLQVILLSILVVIIDYLLTPAFTQFLIDKTLDGMIFVSFYMKFISYVFSLLSFIAGISIGVVSAIHSSIKNNLVEIMRLRFRN